MRLGGTLVTVDPQTGKALAIRRLLVTEQEAARLEPIGLPAAEVEGP